MTIYEELLRRDLCDEYKFILLSGGNDCVVVRDTVRSLLGMTTDLMLETVANAHKERAKKLGWMKSSETYKG